MSANAISGTMFVILHALIQIALIIRVLLRPHREPASRIAKVVVIIAIPAQVVGTGPTIRYSVIPEMFASLMYVARRELAISTPYYVPAESMQAALCASAHRGVDTAIIFPERNDSWIVAAASRSYYILTPLFNRYYVIP